MRSMTQLGAVTTACECSNTSCNFVGAAQCNRGALHPDHLSESLDYRPLPDPGGPFGTAEDAHPCHAWRNLLEKLQPLSTQAILELREARYIATWPRQARDISPANWVNRLREYNGHGAIYEFRDVASGDQHNVRL